jgi:hypothetical protein
LLTLCGKRTHWHQNNQDGGVRVPPKADTRYRNCSGEEAACDQKTTRPTGGAFWSGH